MPSLCDELLDGLRDARGNAKRWQVLEFVVACLTALIVVAVTIAAAMEATTVAVATGVAGIVTGAFTLGLHQRTRYWSEAVLKSVDVYDQKCELRVAIAQGVLPAADAETEARMFRQDELKDLPRVPV
jgi:hypothetical protein